MPMLLGIKLPSKGHQLCLAHLQRDLNYFKDSYPNYKWSEKVKTLFYDSVEVKTSKEFDSIHFKNRLDKLLDYADTKTYTHY